jgi:pimeloyl-ACP methyl ester carboxylesterase
MSPERRRRILRILRTFAIVLVFALVFAPFALGFLTIWSVTHTPCGGDRPPSTAGMDDYDAISFHSDALDGEVRGYFVPGSNGVTVIIPPVLGSGSGQWMPEFTVLHEAGYALFNYQSRNCLGKANSLGYFEAIEVGDALDYLLSRSDVDPQRIAIYGFSAGGAAATLAAARYSQIGAAIAMGGYHDFAEVVDDVAETSWYRPLYYGGAALAYRLTTGLDLRVLRPIAVLDEIAPRPLLLIYGSREASLPGAHLQLEAGDGHIDLLVIEGGTHGSYWQHEPEKFETVVVSFLDAAFGVERR